MKNPMHFRFVSFGLKAGALALTGLLAALANAPAQVWTNDNGGNASGLYSTAANWSPNAVPNAQDAIADFSTLTITNNSFITNDAPVTVGTLVFANPTANGTTWTLDGAGGNLITLDKSSGIPTIAVTNAQVLIGGLSGSQGFEKTGNGALAIYGNTYGNNVTGPIYVRGGLLASVRGLSFASITGDIIVENGASFQAHGGFAGEIYYNNIFLNGTGGSASGFVNNATTPDGTYHGEPQPMGALDVYGNVFISGTITLASDARITHGYNFAWIPGSVVVTNAGQNLELATTVGSGAGGASLFMEGAISLGTGALTISGLGSAATPVVLIGGFFGTNTYAGGTIINGGRLILASGFPATMDTTSGLTFTGAGGALDLGGNSQTLPFLTGGPGRIEGNNTGLGAPTLTINQSINTTYGGGFADGASNILSVVKQGTGSLTVGGMSSHSGPTTVSAGRLLGGSGGGITNSVVQIANGAGNGYVGTTPGGQWTCKELVYDAGTTYINFDFGSVAVETSYPAPVVVNGNVTINGTLNCAITNGIWLGTGTYSLLSYTGTLSPSPTLNLTGLPAGITATLTNDTANKRIALVVTAAPPPVFPGATNGVWTSLANTNFPAINGYWSVTNNWSGGVVASGVGATADFSTLGSLTNSLLVTNDLPRSIGYLRFANASPTNNVSWTLTGGSSNKVNLALPTTGQPEITVSDVTALVGGITGSQGFIKKGNGVLAIFGNTYGNLVNGPITVSEGLLATANGAAFGNINGDITVEAGAAFGVNSRYDGVPVDNTIYLKGTGTSGYPSGWYNNAPILDAVTGSDVYGGSTAPYGALDIYGNGIVSGTIHLLTDSRITHSWDGATISGPIIADGAGKNLVFRTYQASQGDINVNNSISLGTGALTINGTGEQGVALNRSNNISGGVVLMAGELRLGHTNALSAGALTINGGFVNLNTNDVTISSLSGTNGSITDRATLAGTTTLTVDQSVATTFSGIITNGAVRVLALTKAGSWELALGGINNYSGDTTVSAGRLLGVTGGSSANTATTIADLAGNGVRVVTPDGQWVGGAVTYAAAGTQSVLFDFTTNAPSVSVAPLSVNGAVAFDGTVTALITNGVWLGTNNYPLLTASGGFSGTPPTSVVLPPSVGGYLQVAGNTLYLNVTNAPSAAAPQPTILPVYGDGGGNIVIRTVTTSGYNYLLLSTTNLVPPVVWVTNSTTPGTGGPITNTVPVSSTPPNQFFRYLVQ